jgi:hypothetical protein
MTDLSAEARRLLERAKSGQPRASLEARRRVRANVASRIGASSTRDATALRHRTWSAGHAKWLALAGLGAVSGLTAYYQLAPGPERSTTQPSAAQTRELEEPQRSDEPRPQPTAAAPGNTQSSDLDPDTLNLQAELELMRAAQRALQAGQPQAALEALHVHATRFEHGQLSEERTGLQLIAACSLGQPASAAAARYLRAAPRSVLRARLIEACKLRRDP